jgi:hypothetical protein
MTIEDGDKSREHRMTLLAHSRKVGASAAKAGRALVGSEGARDLLLNFCRPQIPLGLIIRKWQLYRCSHKGHKNIIPKNKKRMSGWFQIMSK